MEMKVQLCRHNFKTTVNSVVRQARRLPNAMPKFPSQRPARLFALGARPLAAYTPGMRLFDTLTRTERELRPLDGSTYRFYCCGPTVYGPAHIGNFRTFVLQDVLRRALETGGTRTLHVRNITDVDDKTIRDSQKAGQSLADFTAGWTAKFHTDCDKLGLLPPHIEPGAVEHIPQQIAMIEAFVANGHAYASDDGSVYFKIASFPGYGKLSRLDERELDLGKTQNARANADEYEKDSVSDFVLWKARRPEDGANFWPSPWGDGRPGWHLECSAMIREYLGDSFDLHSGGVDLVFPHHENEIAQSACACGGQFAAHWFHITHLLVDGGKMSKSLGNLYTLADLEARGFTPMEVRYVLIGGHYRKALNFTLDSLTRRARGPGQTRQGRAHARRQNGRRYRARLRRLRPVPSRLGQPQRRPQHARRARRAVHRPARSRQSNRQGRRRRTRRLQPPAARAGAGFAGGSPPPPRPFRKPSAPWQKPAGRRGWPRIGRSPTALRAQLAAHGWLVKDGKDGYTLEAAP